MKVVLKETIKRRKRFDTLRNNNAADWQRVKNILSEKDTQFKEQHIEETIEKIHKSSSTLKHRNLQTQCKL